MTGTATTTADPATETGISRAAIRAGALAGLAVLAPAIAGCGAGGSTAGPPGSTGPAGTTGPRGATGPGQHQATSPHGSGAPAFAWLRPASPPASWHLMRIPDGATLAYPPGWRRIRSDSATASADLTGHGGRIVGYLNITPQQGGETLANWPTFRIHHNADEGDRDVRRLAAAGDLRFLTGRGACVRDSYTTQTGNHYIELACLVAGRHASTVVVAAAGRDAWTEIAPVLERAISGMTT